MDLLYIDWGAANIMVSLTMIILIILPIVILAWVFMKHPEEEPEKEE